MFPFGDFAGNLAAFCRVLRREHGFRLGPGQIHDAARVLDVIDVTDRPRIQLAWRAILSSSRETALEFDAAFEAFFFPGPPGVPQAGLPTLTSREGPRGAGGATVERRPSVGHPDADNDFDSESGPDGAPVMGADAETSDAPADRWARASYSPLAIDGREAIWMRPVSAAWREAARALFRRLQFGMSRRWRPAPRGRRFDLRRIWRASLQTGGEAITARWLRRIQHSPHFVVLIDGSRSMSSTYASALDLAVAIAGLTPRVEVCAFSTALTVLTHHARRAAAGRRVLVELSGESWGGGTSIGASLQAFLHRHGERHVTAHTLVVIVSDGLDVGEPHVLREAMRGLHRRAAGVVWLNPLLETPGYEPTSRAMVAARPFITTFACVTDPAGLARLARSVRLRR